ncbi:heterokaryon incompatibility protein-domain-containing protein [Pyrenochaeta sp. MPI-SDFR-AT-0127]|nr:heterokaryon incompatibility protein-domain-containing protein [Pyrenochaeta sp. MPI-SDFR-AT-0127]
MLVCGDRQTPRTSYSLLIAMNSCHLATRNAPVQLKRKAEFAKEWLHQCESHHPRCKRILKQRNNTMYSPRRLIHLGSNQFILKPKLCETEHISDSPAYATLSHCWGTNCAKLLTTQTQQTFQAGIDASTLPQKFVDAMWWAKELGLQYLWVDTLCIIQDSERDWEHEASVMDKIFTFSSCNIAIVSSTAETSPLAASSKSASEATIIHLPFEDSTFWCEDEALWETGILDKPLLKRGWVLQELILAPRILYLGDHQLFWECATMKACERWPDGLPKASKVEETRLCLVTEPSRHIDASTEERVNTQDREWQRRGALSLPVIASPRYLAKRYLPVFSDTFGGTATISAQDSAKCWRSSASAMAGQRSASFLHLWPEVVARYTKTALTYPDRDKLVAVSGLARAIHFPADYLAGLWRPHLPYSLAWRTTGPGPASPTYQAPSWSWASVNGSVELPPLDQWDQRHHPLYPETAKLLSHDIKYSGTDHTGRVLSGRLSLKAPMMKGTIDSLWHEKSSVYSGFPQDVNVGQIGPIILHLFPDTAGQLKGTLYFLFIHRVFGLDRLFGLVLRLTGQQSGQYCRVGYFQVARTIEQNGHRHTAENEGTRNIEAFRLLWRQFTTIITRRESVHWDKDGITVDII